MALLMVIMKIILAVMVTMNLDDDVMLTEYDNKEKVEKEVENNDSKNVTYIDDVKEDAEDYMLIQFEMEDRTKTIPTSFLSVSSLHLVPSFLCSLH